MFKYQLSRSASVRNKELIIEFPQMLTGELSGTTFAAAVTGVEK